MLMKVERQQHVVAYIGVYCRPDVISLNLDCFAHFVTSVAFIQHGHYNLQMNFEFVIT